MDDTDTSASRTVEFSFLIRPWPDEKKKKKWIHHVLFLVITDTLCEVQREAGVNHPGVFYK